MPAWPTRFIILFGSGLAIINYLVMAYLDVIHPDESTVDESDAAFRPTPRQ